MGETTHGIPYLVMEYVEGETVAAIPNRGGIIHPEQAIELVSQMAGAIDCAHGKGVIHRDIKPSNIMVCKGGKVKVSDFGIARLMDSPITQSGTLVGTPGYMSPEQAMGESLDARTDIFSLGAVAFEMLSGERPFSGDIIASLHKVLHADPVHPSQLEQFGLSPDKWHRVFSRVLAKNRVARHASAAEFTSELAEVYSGPWDGAPDAGKEETLTLLPTRPSLTIGSPQVNLSVPLEQKDRRAAITSPSSANRSPSSPASRSTPGPDAGAVHLKATVHFTGKQLLIRNGDSFDWINVKFQFATGLMLEVARMNAGQSYTVVLPARPQQVFICCDTPKGR